MFLILLSKGLYQMSRDMGNPACRICENKAADQLCDNCAALFSLYILSTKRNAMFSFAFFWVKNY